MLISEVATPDGVENSWHLTMDIMGDDLDDWEFEALVWEIMNFSPFGERIFRQGSAKPNQEIEFLPGNLDQ